MADPTQAREAAAALVDFLDNGPGWHEGRTPEFTCINGADAERLDALTDRLRAALTALPDDGREGLRALSDAATPGPWKQDVMYVVAEVPRGRPGGEVIVHATATAASHRDQERDTRNAAFIVAAVNYVRAALTDKP